MKIHKEKEKKNKKSRNIYALSPSYFVEVCVQLEWQPRTRRVRGCHSNWTETSTKYEGDNAIVINTKTKTKKWFCLKIKK